MLSRVKHSAKEFSGRMGPLQRVNDVCYRVRIPGRVLSRPQESRKLLGKAEKESLEC